MALKAIDGKPVIDSKRAIKLNIIANDINKADRKEPADCAVARACRREFHAKEVRVHLGRVYVRMNDSNWQRFMTPRSLRSEIIAFDRGGTMSPGTFTLQPPSEKKKSSGKRQGGKTVRMAKRVTGQKRVRHIVTDVRGGPA